MFRVLLKIMKKTTLVLFIASFLFVSNGVQGDEVSRLATQIEKAVKTKSAEDYLKLQYRNGAPAELKNALSPMIKQLFKKEQLKVETVQALAASEYKPDVELPGNLDGKKLAYTASPSHWIVIRFNEERIKLVLPSAKFGNEWQIVGVKFAE